MNKTKIRVISDPKTEAADAHAVVCLRVVDMPIPYVPAKIMLCTGCGHRVWFADSSPRGIPIKCQRCVEIHISETDDTMTVLATTEQVAEARAYLFDQIIAGRKKR